METTFFQKLALRAAGLTALGIGSAITFAPHAFYAGYGITLGTDPALLSELRAPGANLAALGAVIFAGALRPNMLRISALLGAIVFFGFAFGRKVGVTLDGWPEAGILTALLVEVVIGTLCLLVLRTHASRDLRVPSVISNRTGRWVLL